MQEKSLKVITHINTHSYYYSILRLKKFFMYKEINNKKGC